MSNHSENINELASALSKAQGEMQAAIKDCINPFFKSKYADLGSVWDAARPVLSKNGLCVMQYTDVVNDKLMMVTMLAHSSGQWIRSYLPLNPSKNDAQGIGAAISYMRRYGLSALVGVVCDDEDDGETASGRGKNNKSPTQSYQPQHITNESQKTINMSNENLDKLTSALALTDATFKKNFFDYILTKWNAHAVNDLPDSSFFPCMTSINNNIRLNQEKVI